MRTGVGAVLAAGVLVVAGCGGDDETTTVVQTVVQTAPAPATTPPAPTEPSAGETVEATTAPPGTPTQEPPPGDPLPGGVATVQGRYRMVYRDYSPGSYNLGDTYTGKVQQWNAETRCSGDSCTVALRRELESGGFKNYGLRQTAPKKYAGTFTAKADACGSDAAATVRERVSIQTSEIADLGGTPTVTGLDVYIKQTGVCRESGDRIAASGTWRGARIGP